MGDAAVCPTDSAGAPLILPFYCNDTELAPGAGFEVFGATAGTAPQWHSAVRVRAGKDPIVLWWRLVWTLLGKRQRALDMLTPIGPSRVYAMDWRDTHYRLARL